MTTPTQANHIGLWLALCEPALAAQVLVRLETLLRHMRPDSETAPALREFAQTLAAELAAEEEPRP